MKMEIIIDHIGDASYTEVWNDKGDNEAWHMVRYHFNRNVFFGHGWRSFSRGKRSRWL